MCFIDKVNCFMFMFCGTRKRKEIKKRRLKNFKAVNFMGSDEMGVLPFKAPFTMLVSGPTCEIDL